MSVKKGGVCLTNIEDDLIVRELLDEAGILSWKLNDAFSALPAREVDIPNIGITYNNKLVEIVQAFKNHGVALDENLLLIVIKNYLLSKVNEASLIFISYVQTFYGKSNLNFLKKAALVQRKKLADRFKALDDEIYNFSLEKDIVAVIIADIKSDLEKEKIDGLNKYNEMANSIIRDYKSTLEQLGVSQVILDSIPSFETGYGSL